MLAQPDTSSSGPVENDGYHPLWSNEARTVANLPQYWNVLQRNHGGCSMHDGSAFSTSSALLLGLHRAAMEPSARGFRESFSPFWEGGDERFRGACEQWQAELIGGLELSEREGLLVCPKGTDHSSLLPLLEALVSARAPPTLRTTPSCLTAHAPSHGGGCMCVDTCKRLRSSPRWNGRSSKGPYAGGLSVRGGQQPVASRRPSTPTCSVCVRPKRDGRRTIH